MLRKLALALTLVLIASCNTSSIRDAIDLAQGVPRKDIDTTRIGVNAFVNDSRFGSINHQFLEVRDTLRLKFVRVLFNWDTAVQPSPGARQNFSFYDNILNGVPEGVDVLVVLTGLPNWMTNSGNWTEGNPRTTFVERWVRAVVDRYKDNPRIIGWEIWNEPNMTANPDNTTLGIATNPENYVEMLARAYSVAKSLAPSKLVLNAATTSINQNYPDSLEYNELMRDAGAQSFLDKWAIHYYGKEYENVVRGGGVQDFLNGLSKPIWVTESGAQGVNSQLAYGEQTWPFLFDKVDSIERIYIYQFTEGTDPTTTYGLKNLSGATPVSDLYVSLRDRP